VVLKTQGFLPVERAILQEHPHCNTSLEVDFKKNNVFKRKSMHLFGQKSCEFLLKCYLNVISTIVSCHEPLKMCFLLSPLTFKQIFFKTFPMESLKV